MPRYLETAEQLHKEVKSFVETFFKDDARTWTDATGTLNEATRQLGHIVNLAVRCNPRQSQGTVRKNIVATAMRGYCKVSMTRETDEVSGREFNKIHIE